MAYYNQHALYHDPTQHARPSSVQEHQQQHHHHLSHAAFQHPQAHQQLAAQSYSSYGEEGTMAMPPPSTMGPSMTGGTMQMGMSQRQPPSAYQQPPSSNNPQHSTTYSPSPANYTAPQSAQAVYQHTTPPIPSPTHSQGPSSNPNPSPARPSMASAMAPNPSPQSLQQQQQQQQAQMQHRPQNSMSQKPILQPPLSPASAERETQRVTILLDINRVLLQEIVQLQAAGRVGPPSQLPAGLQKPGQASSTGTDGDGDTKEEGGANASGDSVANFKNRVQSQEYIQCMRRLQSNLAYLAHIADRLHKPVDQYPRQPAIMDAPIIANSNLSEEGTQDLKLLYAELVQLYPDYTKTSKERGEGNATTTPTGVAGQGQGQVGAHPPPQQPQQMGIGMA